MKGTDYSIILSDVGGVLIENYDATVNDVKKSVALPESTFEPIWKREIEAYGIYGDEEAFWRAFADHGGTKVEANGAVFIEGFEANLHIFHKVIDLMKNSGKTLSILSNTIPPHAELLRERGVYDAFDPNNIFLSHEIHKRKPQRDAYIFAINALAAKPQDILFIDDNEENLVTAREIGMHTLLARGSEDTIVASLISVLRSSR